jgi:hypothetical protein
MKTLKQLFILMFLAVQAVGQNLNPLDAMLVIDNSASMKKNDPGFLLKEALTQFIDSLGENDRSGFILFSDKVDVFIPLSSLKNDTSKVSLKSINDNINYSGRYTNSPAAIEKAFYELKTNGRKDCNKIIILLTDGIIDLADSEKNDEKARWLTEDCNTEKIRIFSIAFTEQADFELLQTLSSKTLGSYYRAITAPDISRVFENIGAELKQTTSQTIQNAGQTMISPPVTPVQQEPETSGKYNVFLLIIVILLIVLIGAAIFFLFLKKKHRTESFTDDLPEAYLVDITGITNKGTFQIKKRITRIGRVPANDLCIPDEKNYVSSFHASIEYKDHNFYLVDQDSVNGTFVNGNRIDKKERVLLKGGDEISFDKFGFKFLCPVEGERGQTVMNMGDSFGTSTIQHLPDDTEPIEDSGKTE